MRYRYLISLTYCEAGASSSFSIGLCVRWLSVPLRGVSVIATANVSYGVVDERP